MSFMFRFNANSAFALSISFLLSTGKVFSTCFDEAKLATLLVPPLVVENRGEISGRATVNIASQFKNDFSYQIKVLPWARALMTAVQGEVDGIFPVLRSPVREEYLKYIEPEIGYVTVSLFKLAGSRPESSNHKMSIATLRSFQFERSVFKGSKIIEVGTFKQATQMLEAGRVDYVLGVKEIIEHDFKQKQESLIEHYQIIEHRPIYLAIAKSSPNYEKLASCLKVAEKSQL